MHHLPSQSEQPLARARLAAERKPSQAGFTFLEVIGVLSIMGILLAVTVPSMTSVLSARSLSSGVSLVSGAAMLARQTAMSSGASVALVATKSSESDSSQSLILLKKETDSSGNPVWKPMTPWKSFPSQVLVQPNLNTFHESDTKPLNGEDTLPIQCAGKDVTDYSYIEFQPDGSVDCASSQNNPALRLQEETRSSYSYLITFQESTGRTKVTEHHEPQQ